MCEKEQKTLSICPYCKSSCFYDCGENGDQMILCLNCGQLFPVNESTGSDSRNEPSIKADSTEQ